MWLVFAFLSAGFAGITAILAKIGIRNVNSNLATALRTIVVLLFSWLMVFIVGSASGIKEISVKTFIFLILSGLATGASWLCYFRALQLGDVNKVAPIDKSSTVLTMILALIFLGEKLTVVKIIGMILIGTGTFLMIEKKKTDNSSADKKNGASLIYALLSAVFAALTSIFGKVGIEGVESNLGTAIRTVVVLLMAWILVFAEKKQDEIKDIDKKSWLFLVLSGFTTGGSWLCYYGALKEGPASIIAPIDKLSIVVTVAFSYIILKEKLSKKAFLGLVLIVAGTLSLLIKY